MANNKDSKNIDYLTQRNKRARIDTNEKRDKYMKLWKKAYLIIRVINSFKFIIQYPSFSESSFGNLEFEQQFGTNGLENFSFSNFNSDDNEINKYIDLDPNELLNTIDFSN